MRYVSQEQSTASEDYLVSGAFWVERLSQGLVAYHVSALHVVARPWCTEDRPAQLRQ